MNRKLELKSVAIRLGLAGAFAVAVPAISAIPVAPALAAQPAQTADMDRAVAALRGISTLRADFVQTDRSGQSLNGVLTLKRPGKIRFQYQDEAKMLIVGDGSALTMIDYEVNQVQRWPIKKSPLGALLDPSRDVSRFGRLVPTGNSDVVSIEVRDPKRPEFGTITMIFVTDPGAPGGLELVSWVALDSQNKRTTVRLANHRYGMDVPNSTFSFKDPRRTGRR